MVTTLKREIVLNHKLAPDIEVSCIDWINTEKASNNYRYCTTNKIITLSSCSQFSCGLPSSAYLEKLLYWRLQHMATTACSI